MVKLRLALLPLILLSACKKKGDDSSPPPEAPAAKEAPAKAAAAKPLVVYCGRSEKFVAPVIDAYKKATGAEVEVKYAGSQELAATLLEEGANSPADIFIAQDASTLAFLDGKGVFQGMPKEVHDRAPKGFRSESGNWVGVSGRARVLAYNTKKLKPEQLPKSAAELALPQWKDRVGWAPPNASFQSFVAAMIQLEGVGKTRSWLAGVLANGAKPYPKNTPAVLAVSRGEVDVALVNHYYLYRLRAEHGDDFPVENFYFKNQKAESMVNMSGAAIVKTSKNQQAGGEFLAFLLSSDGQNLFVKGANEFPVAPGAVSPIGLPTIDTLGTPALNLANLRNLEETVKLLRETGVLR